jgi:hypothetical protein
VLGLRPCPPKAIPSSAMKLGNPSPLIIAKINCRPQLGEGSSIVDKMTGRHIGPASADGVSDYLFANKRTLHFTPPFKKSRRP